MMQIQEDNMQITSFRDMYLAELQELCSVEEQLSQALERAAKTASNPELKDAFTRHREETKLQKKRLEGLLDSHGVKGGHTDQAMEALLQETAKMAATLQGEELRDAGLIASMQKLEHYEIAAYGTAAALAGQLDLRDDQRILHQSLNEEKRTDVLLTSLAKAEINQSAIAAE
jgi:ferritin-like metal-binding protein YciE